MSREMSLPKGYLVRECQEGDEVDYVRVHNSLSSQYGQTITVDEVKRKLRNPKRDKVLFTETIKFPSRNFYAPTAVEIIKRFLWCIKERIVGFARRRKCGYCRGAHGT